MYIVWVDKFSSFDSSWSSLFLDFFHCTKDAPKQWLAAPPSVSETKAQESMEFASICHSISTTVCSQSPAPWETRC